MLNAMFTQHFLDATDRHALIVEQRFHAADQAHVRGSIVPSSACALHRFDLSKPAFPKSQNMGRDIEPLGHFRDCAEGVGRFFHEVGLALVAGRDTIFHQVRRTEGQNATRMDRDFLASFWITTDASRFVAD